MLDPGNILILSVILVGWWWISAVDMLLQASFSTREFCNNRVCKIHFTLQTHLLNRSTICIHATNEIQSGSKTWLDLTSMAPDMMKDRHDRRSNSLNWQTGPISKQKFGQHLKKNRKLKLNWKQITLLSFNLFGQCTYMVSWTTWHDWQCCRSWRSHTNQEVEP